MLKGSYLKILKTAPSCTHQTSKNLQPRGIKLVDAFLDGLGVLLPTPMLCDIKLLVKDFAAPPHQRFFLKKQMWETYQKIT